MSGHIKMKDKKLLNIAKDVIKLEYTSLKKLHSSIGNSFEKIIKTKNNNKFVFTCGSGVTASVLAYAYKIVNKDYQPIIYDGSWSEYGKYSP